MQENLRKATVLYFTSPGCNVCKVLKPKVFDLIHSKYPEIELHFIDVSEDRALAAKYQVYTVPVLLVFFEGKEFYRFVRNISIHELDKDLSRPYKLFFR